MMQIPAFAMGYGIVPVVVPVATLSCLKVWLFHTVVSRGRASFAENNQRDKYSFAETTG